MRVLKLRTARSVCATLAAAVAAAAAGACGRGAERDYERPASLFAASTRREYRRDTASGMAKAYVRVANRGTTPAVLVGCGRADRAGGYALERRHRWSWVDAAPARPVCPTPSGGDTVVAVGRTVVLPVAIAEAGRYRLRIRYHPHVARDTWSIVQSTPFVIR